MSENTKAPFNPTEHVMQLKSKDGLKDYLPVQWRIVWFRDVFPHGEILTEELLCDPQMEITKTVSEWDKHQGRYVPVVKTAQGYARYKATVRDGIGGVAQGTKTETAVDFPDYAEKCETGAIGRALAALGFGTQFAPELNEENRIADAPVERANGASRPAVAHTPNPIADQVPSTLIHVELKKKLEPVMQAYARSQSRTLTQTWWPDVLKEIFGTPLPNPYTTAHVAQITAYREGVEQLVREANKATA